MGRARTAAVDDQRYFTELVEGFLKVDACAGTSAENSAEALRRLVVENLAFKQALGLHRRAAALQQEPELETLVERLVESLCEVSGARSGVLWIAADSTAARLQRVCARGPVRLAEPRAALTPESLGEPLFRRLRAGEAVYRAAGERARGGSPILYLPLRDGGALMALARLSDWPAGSSLGAAERRSVQQLAALSSPALAQRLIHLRLERHSARGRVGCEQSPGLLQELARSEFARCRRDGGSFSILCADLGIPEALRQAAPDSAQARWLRRTVQEVRQALRATDAVAIDGAGRLVALLPGADSLGASISKDRVRALLARDRRRGRLQTESPAEPVLAVATHPGDAADLDSLQQSLEQRLLAERGSLVSTLCLRGRSLPEAFEALLGSAEPVPLELPTRILRFLFGEVARRRDDRGLLVLSPPPELLAAARDGLAEFTAQASRITCVLLADDEPETEAPGGWISRQRIDTEISFLLYLGEGPAYAGVCAPERAGNRLSFFHSADRALVEQLALQLRRELSIPVAA